MNLKSKYLVLATTLLLALSSSASIATAATHGTLFPATAVDTHGPRVGAIDFSVIASDPSLAGSLVTGTIQAPEWTFTAGSFESLAASANVATGKTEGYTFEGIVFNGIQPIISTYDFRQAIQLLTVYTGSTSIATTILSGDLAGVATADLMPCNLYAVPTSASCKTTQASNGISADQVHPEGWVSSQIKDDQAAAVDLATIQTLPCAASRTCGWASSLYAQLAGVNVTAGTIAGWSVAQATANLPSLSWYVNGSAKTPFFPNLQYRTDDPLRSGFAVLLVSYASDIGLAINAKGITDAEADATVYTDFAVPLTSPGGYCSPGAANETTANLGSNNCPSAVYSDSSSIQALDPWDMYTYGWVASSNFEFQGGEWMNTQFLSDGINTGYITSNTCDTAENVVLYSPTYAGAATAAVAAEKCSVQNLPDIVGYYESYLFGNYINGWTGYTNLPSCGANTVSCAYYTMLNAHSTTSPFVGGTLNYAVHGAAATAGLDPIYGTNWVWQADLWSELYDSPLATPPTALTVPGAWFPYELSGETTPTSTYGCEVGTTGCIIGPNFGNGAGGVQVQTFSLAKTGVGTGISNIPANAFCIQNTTTTCDLTIPNGEAITYTFNTNMTWSDGVPITAYDYNYSLWALDVAGTPALANAADYTPFAFEDSGPFGLLATVVTPPPPGQGGGSITMYMGDQAFWNIIAVNVDFLPQHIFQYINVYNAFSFHSNIDPTQTYATEYAANPAYFASGAGTGVPAGVCDAGQTTCPLAGLGNLEVSSGPFYLTTFVPATGAGVMTANLNYYRTAWWDALVPNEVSPGGTITFTASPTQFTTSGIVPFTSVGSGVTNAVCTATVQKYSGAIPAPTTNKYVGSPSGSPISASVSGCGTATTTITISTTTSFKGNYKVSFEETFTLNGVPDYIWYQYYGFAVTPTGSASVTGTPTS